MTPRQKRFVEAYLRLQNGRAAALEAGYAPCCVDAIASRNLRLPEIAQALVEAGLPLAFQPQSHRRVLPFLTERQQRFVQHYLACGNGAEAARRAGYSRRSSIGIASYLLRRPPIEAAIAAANEERARTLRIDAEHVLGEWARLGFADIGAFVACDANGRLVPKPFAELSADARAAIAEITISEGKDGTSRVKLKMHDKLRALSALGKHLGLDKKEAKPPAPSTTIDGKDAREVLRERLLRLARSEDGEGEG